MQCRLCWVLFQEVNVLGSLHTHQKLCCNTALLCCGVFCAIPCYALFSFTVLFSVWITAECWLLSVGFYAMPAGHLACHWGCKITVWGFALESCFYIASGVHIVDQEPALLLREAPSWKQPATLLQFLYLLQPRRRFVSWSRKLRTWGSVRSYFWILTWSLEWIYKGLTCRWWHLLICIWHSLTESMASFLISSRIFAGHQGTFQTWSDWFRWPDSSSCRLAGKWIDSTFPFVLNWLACRPNRLQTQFWMVNGVFREGSYTTSEESTESVESEEIWRKLKKAESEESWIWRKLNLKNVFAAWVRKVHATPPGSSCPCCVYLSPISPMMQHPCNPPTIYLLLGSMGYFYIVKPGV